MTAYKEIITLFGILFFGNLIFAQSGTIKVQKESNTEIFGLESNRSGNPQSYILLVDDQKAVFINSYFDARTVMNMYENGDKIEGRVLPGQYKREGEQIFIFLIKGIQFKGSHVNNVLYLTDYTGEQVIFYKVML